MKINSIQSKIFFSAKGNEENVKITAKTVNSAKNFKSNNNNSKKDQNFPKHLFFKFPENMKIWNESPKQNLKNKYEVKITYPQDVFHKNSNNSQEKNKNNGKNILKKNENLKKYNSFLRSLELRKEKIFATKNNNYLILDKKNFENLNKENKNF